MTLFKIANCVCRQTHIEVYSEIQQEEMCTSSSNGLYMLPLVLKIRMCQQQRCLHILFLEFRLEAILTHQLREMHFTKLATTL